MTKSTKRTEVFTDITERYNNLSEEEKHDIAVAAGGGLNAYRDGKEEGILKGTILGAVGTGVGVLLADLYLRNKETVNTKVKKTVKDGTSKVKNFFCDLFTKKDVIDGDDLVEEVSEDE